MMGVLVGAVIVCVVGAVDDIRELDWLTKLAGQMLAAGVMAFKGVQLLSLPLFGVTVLPASLLVTLTILIVIISSNAVNFIDGLDGLATGVVAIAGLAFFSYSYLLSRTYDPPNVFSSATFITAALVGCCVGFLPHNFHPARLFMGDSGSLMLGLLLAAATISMTGNIDPGQVEGNPFVAISLPVVLPLAILSLPLLDVLLAVVRRTRAGRRPWSPDAEHLHHRMLRMGHTHVQAVLVLYLWAAVVSLGVVSFAFVGGWLPIVVIVLVVISATVLTRWLPRWMPARRL
jgi:UDP-GlcNAc:undecaprenyl-phosphate GlcNAc-1-phosphate transferase